MTQRSGQTGQVGFVEEVTWGLPVTVTRFLPLTSESIKLEKEYLESAGVIAGARVLRSAQSSDGGVMVSGDLGFDLYDRSIGLLFKHAFGAVNTTGAGPYTHTFTPGELSGKGLTVQLGRTNSVDGTVHPFTYSGMKVASWELACSAGEYATFGVSLVGRDEILLRTVADGVTTSGSPTVTSATAAFTQSDVGKPISGAGIPANSFIGVVNSATSVGLSSSSFANTPANASATATSVTFTLGIALASASYAASIAPMSFIGASVTLGGSTYKAKSVTISGDNGLDTDRAFLGQGTRDEPLETALREYTGTLDSEFFGMTDYRRFVTGTEAALVLAFGRGASTCTITCNVRFDGETPNLDGTGIVPQTLPFKCLGTTTDAAGITAVLVNGDSTP